MGAKGWDQLRRILWMLILLMSGKVGTQWLVVNPYCARPKRVSCSTVMISIKASKHRSIETYVQQFEACKVMAWHKFFLSKGFASLFGWSLQGYPKACERFFFFARDLRRPHLHERRLSNLTSSNATGVIFVWVVAQWMKPYLKLFPHQWARLGLISRYRPRVSTAELGND